MAQIFLLLGILSFIKYLGFFWIIEGFSIFAFWATAVAISLYLAFLTASKLFDLSKTNLGKSFINVAKISTNGTILVVAFLSYFAAGTLIMTLALSAASFVLIEKGNTIGLELALASIISLIFTSIYFRKRLKLSTSDLATKA